MNIDWEKIKKEYPKSYKKFCDYLLIKHPNDNDFCIQCEIEQFFKDNRIIMDASIYKAFEIMEGK